MQRTCETSTSKDCLSVRYLTLSPIVDYSLDLSLQDKTSLC